MSVGASLLAMNLQATMVTRSAASSLTFFASELAPTSQRPILMFVSNPQTLNTM
jgi:S-adenosylmethionine:diacylglycerol 3-amino-3-carboxypropyl transferase